ncbi:SAUR-like auxin-responsive protein family [Forsythia ovata]|uniref:SAUR-like auxin-responsive protein family n=1 Tax=Forsythia ovata TaxID=205694 RepID=A0ABD1PYM4_9LAMI
MGKCNKIGQIVRIRQMLRRWRQKATFRRIHGVPSDVPAGHVAISVGSSCRRFVVRATYLNHPIFEKLLTQAAEEYGFANSGALAIPCDETVFEEILQFVARPESVSSSRCINLEDFQRSCNVGIGNNNLHFFGESMPLLSGYIVQSQSVNY